MSVSSRADLIIVGRIATLAGSEGFGWQPAVAIGGGRVIGVGSESELESRATRATQWWRLGDEQMVMPGITDAHLHLMTLILAESQLDLTGLDRAAALDTIHVWHVERLARGDERGWLLGHGWSAHGLGGWPDAQMLEHVAPGRPVALYAHDHHARWVSHHALALADPGGARAALLGTLVRRGEDGRPSGILHEGASAVVDEAIPDPSREELVRDLMIVARRLASLGVTGCHDPGELNDDRVMKRGPLFYRDLAEHRDLPLRVHGSIREPQLDRAIALGLHSGESVGRYTTGWLKLFADGSLGSRSAALLEPYEDAHANPPTGGPRGMVVSDADELTELLTRAARAGIGGQVHAIGDGAVRSALDVFERVPRADTPLMARVEHAQLVDPADQQRFSALRVAASVQPVHLRSDAVQQRLAWGSRAENSFPLKTLIDSGAVVPFGTDAPVEPPDPWAGIATAVYRRDPVDARATPTAAAQAITVVQALRSACLHPALVAGRDDRGRLLPGFVADLLVVPAAMADDRSTSDEIAALRPVATLLDGELVNGGI